MKILTTQIYRREGMKAAMVFTEDALLHEFAEKGELLDALGVPHLSNHSAQCEFLKDACLRLVSCSLRWYYPLHSLLIADARR